MTTFNAFSDPGENAKILSSFVEGGFTNNASSHNSTILCKIPNGNFLENINACLFFDWKFFVNILLANFGDG